ncbi:MAG TPA: 4Fe-4S binding protein [Syntrophales bacterium]|nr:4Fe-4S binding protein [Syntrophales bacterium]
MTQDIYERLAAHLDNLPGGFPRTESGVELRILKRLFTEEEAALVLYLRMKPEPLERIARRASLPPEELADKLYQMSRKGLIFRADTPDGPRYMTIQYVVGIWEYHVNDLDEDLIRDMNEYIPHLVYASYKLKTHQVRTIPVSTSLEGQGMVMPYEHARKLIEEQSKIVVAPCICRKEHAMIGEGCGKLVEACLVFSSAAYFYENNRLGRSISREEAMQILATAEVEGLVLQPTNAQDITAMCLCCGDCCQILKNLKRLPHPASLVHANYYVRIRREDCIGCEACVERCQMEAIRMQDDVAEVDLDRCIGCGLCVTACSSEAINLVRKDEKDCYTPPDNVVETYMRIAQERGLMK